MNPELGHTPEFDRSETSALKEHTLESLMPELTKEEIEKYKAETLEEELKGPFVKKDEIRLFENQVIGRGESYKLLDCVDFQGLEKLDESPEDEAQKGVGALLIPANSHRLLRGIILADTREIIGYSTQDEAIITELTERVQKIEDFLKTAESDRSKHESEQMLNLYRRNIQEAKERILRNIK